MLLRPHHLMCIQGYEGKGYDQNFINNMTYVTNQLKTKSSITVKLVLHNDDICQKCPNINTNNHCLETDKVMNIDNKMMAYFNLKTGIDYVYGDLVKEIKSQLTEEIMNDICGTCRWYSISACKKNMLEQNNDPLNSLHQA